MPDDLMRTILCGWASDLTELQFTADQYYTSPDGSRQPLLYCDNLMNNYVCPDDVVKSAHCVKINQAETLITLDERRRVHPN